MDHKSRQGPLHIFKWNIRDNTPYLLRDADELYGVPPDAYEWLQRILQVDYEMPPQVKASKECRNILSRILVAQPQKRITIPEIQRHPWYLKDLPPGVVDMNDHLPPVSANAQVTQLIMCMQHWDASQIWPDCRAATR